MNKKNIDNKLAIYKLTSKEKVLEYYDNWTEMSRYNKDMIEWQYIAPKNSVDVFKKYALNKKIKILDAGCGTGLVGIELIKAGYSNLTGVDFSRSMINLVPKNLYKSLKLVDLNKPLQYKNNYFDAVMCVGTFTYGHVKAHALNEFIRIIKKDGLICFTINEGIYQNYEFDKKIDELSKNNFWQVLKLKKSGYIINKDVRAWLCLARVN